MPQRSLDFPTYSVDDDGLHGFGSGGKKLQYGGRHVSVLDFRVLAVGGDYVFVCLIGLRHQRVGDI